MPPVKWLSNRGKNMPSPEEKLRSLEERVRSVRGLPIKEAEQELGVKGYTKDGESNGYLSPQVYKQVRKLKSPVVSKK